MGEISEAIVEGEICQMCCCSDDNGVRGYPFTCTECGGGVDENKPHPPTRTTHSPRNPCPVCGKNIADAGLPQHTKAKHPDYFGCEDE